MNRNTFWITGRFTLPTGWFSLSAVHCPALLPSCWNVWNHLQTTWTDICHSVLSAFSSRVEVEVAFNITLGISSFVMCDAAWWLYDEFSMENITWVSKRFVTFVCQFFQLYVNELERTLFFHVTFKRLFFLTLDGIAFDHFLPVRISLNVLTLHISIEFSQWYF